VKYAGILFAAGTVFFGVVGTIYAVWSRDWIGGTALIFTGFMTALIAFYTLYTAKRLDNRPEDDMQANQDEAAPDYGFYSPHSWWPLPMGFSAMLVALGLIFATWLLIAGVIFLMMSIVGLVFEYYRGDFAH
jgi:protein-S-isoprenylcysteine O-methyltransferase Ste14